MVSSKSQKNTLHSLLSTNLRKLTITLPPSSSSTTGTDFDFSDVFGPPPLTPHHHAPPSPSTSASPPPTTSWEPPVIHNRSHSFVGPSPRYTTTPPSLPFHVHEELEAEEEDLERNEVGLFESKISESSSSSTTTPASTASTKTSGGGGEGGGEGQNGKLGPADFEILRVVGRGAFGKVFQVRLKKKESESGDGDGIYAMKVMRKDGIIKKNHVGYMKAERDILTKVVHPFIVRLRFSFQVPPHLLSSGRI